jgi:hypothetical protein
VRGLSGGVKVTGEGFTQAARAKANKKSHNNLDIVDISLQMINPTFAGPEHHASITPLKHLIRYKHHPMFIKSHMFSPNL